MKTNLPHRSSPRSAHCRIGFTVMLLLTTLTGLTAPFGTDFTYQGRLDGPAGPASGLYDFTFGLHIAASGGPTNATVTKFNVAVSNGLFTTALDFGPGIFNGTAYWLQIGVRSNGSVAFTPLSPRQPLTPTPNAHYATLAGNLNGTLADARLSANVALRAGGNNFTGNQVFSGGNLSFNDASTSLLFPATSGANTPMIHMFASGTGNADRMVLSHSPSFPNWGLQYQDSTDQFNFLSGGFPVMTVALALGTRNVGIGTANPEAKLQVSYLGGVGVFSGDLSPFGAAAFESHQSISTTHAYFAENGNGVFSVTAGGAGYFAGNLGIGTTTPLARLAVNGNTRIDAQLGAYSEGLVVNCPPDMTAFGGYGGLSFHNAERGGVLGSGTAQWTVGYSYTPEAGVGGGGLSFIQNNANTRLYLASNGNVGIGSTSPSMALDVRDGPTSEGGHVHIGGLGANGVSKQINFGDGDYVHIGEIGADDVMELKATRFFVTSQNPASGQVGIGTAAPSEKLHVVGNILASGSASVCALTIRGGCDLAEPFQMSGKDLPKGAVVVIDEANPGHLRLSESAYDTRVAGIISGANGVNPGISLHQEGVMEGGQNVALSGRVYVQADASTGAIKPGDLLTTSATPGHAMKVADHTKAQGAILGKAMTALAEGKGMVLVLVTLQ